MAEISRKQRQKLGAVLLKIQTEGSGFTDEEWQLAKILEGKALAKRLGPDLTPKVMTAEEHQKHQKLVLLTRYELTGPGAELCLRFTERQLRAGKYLWPGELPWYDRWPWKMLWPALVSVITTLIINAAKGTGPK